MPDLEMELKDGVFSVTVSGYCNETTGDSLVGEIKKVLEEGKARKFLMDFSACEIVNSCGVAKVLDAVEMIGIDFQGKVIICGLNVTTKSFFDMVGVFDSAEFTSTLAEARKFIKSA